MVTLMCCYSGRGYTRVLISMHHCVFLSLHIHVSCRCLLKNEYRLHENGKKEKKEAVSARVAEVVWDIP